jgi:hypothetical protein
MFLKKIFVSRHCPFKVAACQPPALAAVISLYSTDNRFQDDIHYKVHIVLS